MKCPHCGKDSFQSVLTCTECGQELDLGASLRVNTRVQSNLGTVIGAKIEHLHAPVIKDNLYNTQVYVWHGDWTERAWEELLDEAARPYKYLEPYTARERALFAGRGGEARLLSDRIISQRLVLVHGKQGVGKSSLMNAGVIPNLMETRMMVVSVDDYHQPVESVLRSLDEQRAELGLELDGLNTLSGLLLKIVELIDGTLTLVLDHFERLFGPALERDMREAMLGELRTALDAIEDDYLRIVFVADQSIFEHIGELEAFIPNLSFDHFELRPLPWKRAREAILQPILNKPTHVLYKTVPYNEDFLDRVLLGDLDALTDETDQHKFIHPQHLGIVCSALYDKSVLEGVAYINQGIYDQLDGAQGILANHFKEQLRQDMHDMYEPSRDLLLRMAIPGMPDWISAQELSRNGNVEDARIMESLVQAGYLARRSPNGHPEYAFPSDSAAAVVETLDKTLMANRRQAHEVLELAWNLWVQKRDDDKQEDEKREPATPGQLRYLADYGEHLELRLDRALFLLYSALAKNVTTARPFAWLEGAPHSKKLIKHFEEPDQEPLPDGITHSIERESRILLGLEGLEAPPWDLDPKIPCGPLAWAAVQFSKKDPVKTSAKTATLALMHGYGYGGWNRIDWALGKLKDPRKASRLRAARQGLLMDELPGYRDNMQEPTSGDVRRIWGWRFWRGLSRNASDLGWMAAGAALGAGLLTGLMRFTIALFAVSDIAGISFAIQGYWNAILAAGAALGALLASPLLLDGRASEKELPGVLKPFALSDAGERRLSVLLGTLGFAFFFILAAIFNGVNFAARPLLLVTAPIAGLGVALGLAWQPGASRPQGATAWARRLVPGGLGFVLSQVAAQIAGLSGAGTITNKAPKYYIDEFSYLLPIQRLFESTEWVPILLSLLDAAAIGALLTAGMILGIYKARSWRARWDTFVRHTED